MSEPHDQVMTAVARTNPVHPPGPALFWSADRIGINEESIHACNTAATGGPVVHLLEFGRH
jgi:hypothetical protein